MDLNIILEKLNNDEHFKKKYEAVIEVKYIKEYIKITRKEICLNIDDNNPIVYNPDPFIIINNYNENSRRNKKNYCFYLTIIKNWFSTEIFINNIYFSQGFNKKNYEPKIKSYRSYNIDIDSILDYIYNIEWCINNDDDTNINSIIASNEYICKKCNSKIYLFY